MPASLFWFLYFSCFSRICYFCNDCENFDEINSMLLVMECGFLCSFRNKTATNLWTQPWSLLLTILCCLHLGKVRINIENSFTLGSYIDSWLQLLMVVGLTNFTFQNCALRSHVNHHLQLSFSKFYMFVVLEYQCMLWLPRKIGFNSIYIYIYIYCCCCCCFFKFPWERCLQS